MKISAETTLKWFPTTNYGKISGLESIRVGGICDVPLERLETACREFEAIFLHELLKAMRRTVPEFQGTSKAIYQGLMDQEFARIMARKGIGLTEVMVKRLRGSCGPWVEETQVLEDFADISDGTL